MQYLILYLMASTSLQSVRGQADVIVCLVSVREQLYIIALMKF
jgi:hypothetical protein